MRLVNELLTRLMVGVQELKAKAVDENGQTLAEYALILAVISLVVIAAGVTLFRDTIGQAFTDVAGCISDPTSC
jgi:Flp pilus assembly pilin Flp